MGVLASYYDILHDTGSLDMSNDPKKRITLSISNVGPFFDGGLNLKYDKLNQYRIAILAKNGAGKTTISRMFRLFSVAGLHPSNDYLSIDENNGSFLFESDDESCSITLTRNSDITIGNPSHYIFHVFNSDYVKDNVESANFVYSDTKEGYILGKGNIDVSREKANKENKEKEIIELAGVLESTIENARVELKKFDVKDNTNEMQQFNLNGILSGERTNETESYELLKEEYSKLSAMADLPSFASLKLLDEKIFDGLGAIIGQSHNHSELGKEFTDVIKNDLDFYEHGVILYKANEAVCPFCNQTLSSFAKSLIEKYEKYIEDEESKILSTVKGYRLEISKLCGNIKTIKAMSESNRISYEKERLLFDNMADDSVQSCESFESLITLLQQLDHVIECKEKDVTYSKNISGNLNDIIRHIQTCNTFIKTLEGKIELLKFNFSKKKNAQLDKKRRMCNAKYNQLLSLHNATISKYNNLSLEIGELDKTIKEKENSIRENRKDKIIKTLKSLLNTFFNGKYDLNEEEMTIVFRKGNSRAEAFKILSEGEKTIVAFCLYLSSVHSIVNDVYDYNKLFFIIDDPISSLDFDHLYDITTIIRGIPELCGIQHSNYIILTHNTDFFNLITSGRIVTDAFHIRGSRANYTAEKTQILPYDHHLYDIICVADEKQKPTHTTPNSIRHVLETIMFFESSFDTIGKFIKDKKEFELDPSFYQVIEDLSHGRVRTGLGTTDESMIRYCKMVKTFVENNYPGQIKTIEKELKNGQL